MSLGWGWDPRLREEQVPDPGDPGDPGNAAPEGPWLRHGAQSPPVLTPLRPLGTVVPVPGRLSRITPPSSPPEPGGPSWGGHGPGPTSLGWTWHRGSRGSSFIPGPALSSALGPPAPPRPPLPGDPVTARPGPAVGHRSPGGGRPPSPAQSPHKDQGKRGGCGAIRAWGSKLGLEGWDCGMGVPSEAGGVGGRIRVTNGEGGAGLWNGGS